MNQLCATAKISKEKIELLLGSFKTETIKIKHNNKKDYDTIDSIQYNQSDISNYNNTDEDYEYKHIFRKRTSKSMYDMHLSEKFKIHLPKSAIKQYLLYHFIPRNHSYVRKGVSFKEIARLCKVSIPTAKKNHSILQKVGLVYSTKSGFGKIDIVIDEEFKLHYSKENGGKGYLTISRDTLYKLIDTNELHNLRINIKSLTWVDARTSKLGKKILFNKDNFLSYLPKYVRKSNKLLNKIIGNDNLLFPIRSNSLDTSNYESKKSIEIKYKNIIKNKLIEFFDKKKYIITSNCSDLIKSIKHCKDHNLNYRELQLSYTKEFDISISDLVDVCIKYGENNIIPILEYSYSNMSIFNDELDLYETSIENPGALINKFINDHMYRFGSLCNKSILLNNKTLFRQIIRKKNEKK